MDLKIMSFDDAVKYRPVKPTYAIRIFSGFEQQNSIEVSKDLRSSRNYVYISNYVFDDIDSRAQAIDGLVLISDNIAEDIIFDFGSRRKNIECLLVHCWRGRNRSPAVAIALNEIFELGGDTKKLKESYGGFWGYNVYVYNTLIRVARERDLVSTVK